MPVERSAGIILFRNTSEGRRYLVLHASQNESFQLDFWDFPKGLLNGGEKGIDAAMRETKEETGVYEFELIPEFKETVRYFTRREGKPVPKFVAMFLAEAHTDTVTLSWEHDRYEWLPYEEARARISRPEMKRALQAAEASLNQKSI